MFLVVDSLLGYILNNMFSNKSNKILLVIIVAQFTIMTGLIWHLRILNLKNQQALQSINSLQKEKIVLNQTAVSQRTQQTTDTYWTSQEDEAIRCMINQENGYSSASFLYGWGAKWSKQGLSWSCKIIGQKTDSGGSVTQVYECSFGTTQACGINNQNRNTAACRSVTGMLTESAVITPFGFDVMEILKDDMQYIKRTGSDWYVSPFSYQIKNPNNDGSEFMVTFFSPKPSRGEVDTHYWKYTFRFQTYDQKSITEVKPLVETILKSFAFPTLPQGCGVNLGVGS